MPAITVASANLAYEKAITKLSRACSALEHHIPPDGETDPPPLRPTIRRNSIAACALCANELANLPAGDRESHVCTHEEQRDIPADDDATSVRSESGHVRRVRNQQPKIGVVKEYMEKLETCLDSFTDAISILCSVLETREEKLQYQEHLTVWVEHCECLNVTFCTDGLVVLHCS